MPNVPVPPLVSRFVFASILVLAGVTCSAQQPKVLAPHQPVAPKLGKHRPLGPSTHQSAIGGLWMTGESMKASLYLTNGLKTDSLTVTPILYLGNGLRFSLDSVTLPAEGTAIVDLNQALSKHGIAPYATLYGYAEIEYQWPWAVACASIRNVDVARSLIFIYELQPPPERMPMPTGAMKQDAPQSFEGMWWKQEPGISGFVSLSNTTARPVKAQIRVTDNQDAELSSYNLTISPHGTKLLTLNELLSASSTTGGIYVTSDAAPHTLVVNAGLQDPSTGYSAPLRLVPVSQAAAAPQDAISHTTFAELGLMTGEADPMMSFPVGTVFVPYSVVRNTSSQPATVVPTIWWMEAGAPRSVALARITVPAHKTVDLDAPSLIASAGLTSLKGTFNLTLDTAAQDHALLLASGSVDLRNTYVFEVSPRAISETASKSLSYWSTGNGDDTMIALWNPADEPQDFVLTLYYVGGHYLYPVHLEARASRNFNLSEILHGAGQDAEGNIIPAGTHEGSAELSGSESEVQHILVSMDAGTFNVNKAICGVYCQTCNGVVSNGLSIVDNPFGVAVGGTKQQTFYMQWNGGAQYNINSGSTWWTSDSSLATASSAVVTGVSPGSITLYSQYQGTLPVYVANYCTPGYPCPTMYYPTGQGGGNVTPPTAIVAVSFTGQKSNGDNLLFGTTSCSEQLGGPLTCPNAAVPGWFWNVEVRAVASDDASKWTVTQTIDSQRSKGFKRDSQGTLHAFDTGVTSVGCPPCDGPTSPFLQQASGQKNIFYLDAPGAFMALGGDAIDSGTWAKNFTAHFCSTVVTTACYTKQYYVRIVISPGAFLDAGNSAADLGTTSTDF